MNAPVSEDLHPGADLRLRPAIAGDLEAILAVKQRLRLSHEAAADAQPMPRGGFLLGTSPAQYARLIAGGRTRVLTDRGVVVGFTTALADAELRASDLWQRRGQIDLGERAALLSALEQLPLAYLDQLALLPDPKYRLCGALLAYHAVAALFAEGSAVVITTVVDKPRRNLASRPLLQAVGALRVGSVAEHYPEVGAVTSDVFVVPSAALDPEAQDDARRRARLRRLAALSRSMS